MVCGAVWLGKVPKPNLRVLLLIWVSVIAAGANTISLGIPGVTTSNVKPNWGVYVLPLTPVLLFPILLNCILKLSQSFTVNVYPIPDESLLIVVDGLALEAI